MEKIRTLLHDIYALTFPDHCAACLQAISVNENYLCADCRLNLPLTNFHLTDENPVKKMFWGRIPVEFAMSYFFFSKQSRVQHLIHRIKYYGLKELAVEIGRMMGRAIEESNRFKNSLDLIVPVPLHPRKLKKRGFNQSEYLAQGIAEILLLPLITNNLIRVIHSPSQTRKSRFQRWKNVAGIFEVKNPDEFKNKHVLLVDDVITTGSTIEACYLPLSVIPDLKFSIASIGFAHDV